MNLLTVFRRLALIVCAIVVGLSLAAKTPGSQDGKLIRERVHSRALENNVTGDSPDRAVSVYLPPTYESAKSKRYPVVYLLHGIGDTDAEFTSAWTGNTEDWGTIQGLMNHGIREGLFGEMIIVMPDERTKMGGSFYTNSSSTGNWEDFTVRELVSFIDGKYRTLARRECRGIAGHSMGGYGAITLGMKHPEIFSVVYAMNPALLGLAADVSFENPAFASLVKITSIDEVLKIGGYAAGAIALAQAFSPDPKSPPSFAELPFRVRAGRLEQNELVHRKWEANFAVEHRV